MTKVLEAVNRQSSVFIKAEALHPITTLDEISARYKAVFCDVWGVVHNGVAPFHDSVDALWRARDSGVKIVLVTNSPRPNWSVIQQLGEIGVGSACFDAIVTSGDVTRKLIEKAPPKLFHIGNERELSIYEGFEDTHQLVEEAQAEMIVCTGLFHDEQETLEDYAPLLKRLAARKLPMICANPDIVVERGSKIVFCAGALARDYAALGGQTSIAGKPHKQIYEAAHKTANELAGHELAKSEILAIGDGLFTDIKGANDYGVEALYVAAGVHVHEYLIDGAIDQIKMASYVESNGFKPVASIARLA
ncbi:MAG: TIGR01459 family HAD-type hydrolase [Notoacmeibacter sp.]